MFRVLFLVALTLTATATAAGARGFEPGQTRDFRPYGEGLPLPWPFPWAKECPVQWSSLSGRYTMLDSETQDEVELKISIVTDRGLRLLRISRYNSAGKLISDGFTYLTLNQRSVRVHLHPLWDNQPDMWANIKLYHSSDFFSCEMSSLVPILTIVERRDHITRETLYRLVRRPLKK